MGNIVNTNTAATASKNALALNQRSLDKTMSQLSTGQRINSAADDAAGLAIVSKMTTQIRSLHQAVRNANDGISMLQTADAATNQMTQMLFRMRELALVSANGTNDNDGKDALQLEFSGLQSQISNIINNTSWNGMNLLAGGLADPNGDVYFQIGAGSSESISLPLTALNNEVDVSNALANTLLIGSEVTADPGNAISLIDLAIIKIDNNRSSWGATINRLTHAADNSANVSLNSAVSRSRIMDTDYAQATAEMARAMILEQAGSAMLSQANQQPTYILALLR